MTSGVLTIAGSDSGGGAGIQGDLKTFTALSVYGASVLTCVTSQNTAAVDGIHPLPAEFVKQQLHAVLSDIPIHAVKTGMLLNKEIIDTVANVLKSEFPNGLKLVVDPVMVATSGSVLLEKDAIESMRLRLLPMAFIITPNIPEAKVLVNRQDSVTCLSDMKSLAKELALLGPEIVLLKGGHLALDQDGNAVDEPEKEQKRLHVIDVVYFKSTDSFLEVKNEYIKTKNTHGTGCTLSAAIAAKLTRCFDTTSAILESIVYVHGAIQHAFDIGKGSGPLNHFHAIVPLSVQKKSWSNPKPFCQELIQSCGSLWKEYTHHPFVEQMAQGTLPLEAFKFYIKQDYHFLIHYARANGLGAYKSKTLEEADAFAKTVSHIHHESKLHVDYCESFGISRDELFETVEAMETVAYTRYVIDKGHSGDVLDLQIAIAPCMIGYGEIGLRLFNDPKTKRQGNPYWKWICNYADVDFQAAVENHRKLLEDAAVKVQPSSHRLKELCKIFREGTMLEISFWQMGLNRVE